MATVFGSIAALNRSVIAGNSATKTAGGIFNLASATTLSGGVVGGNSPNNCTGSSPAVADRTG
ncbi:MAG: hypothetical protein HOY76_44040 [Streptomyces sp.]|nr:hypothetical protein [Streptomyces sp.]NUS86482.1 hypothetical protein [Streptomyces sp.]